MTFFYHSCPCGYRKEIAINAYILRRFLGVQLQVTVTRGNRHQDISGSPVSLDVGMCRSHCLSQKINSYQSGFPGLSKHSSVLDFLRTKKQQDRQVELPLSTGAERSCPLDSQCEPTRVHVERVLLFEGVQEVEVIETCQCSANPEECLRLPSLKTFFPDTPLEFTVDVGKCSNPSQARDRLFCVPTKFDSVLLKSPNGVEVVRTLENCEMKETCYRVSYVEYYYEIVHNSTGDREERLKEIDVGHCLGSCTSGNHCLLRDLQNGEKCLVWAEGASSHCIPHQYNTHTFKSRSDHIRTVFAIQNWCCIEGPVGLDELYRCPNMELCCLREQEEDAEDVRTEALKRLLEVFGIEDPPRSPHHIKQPPQYMVDLYNTVAGADGITKDPDILEGNTVRSFLDKIHSDQMHFLFVLSSVAKNERILTAELHLFRLRTKVPEGPLYMRHHFCQVSVYQVLDKNKLDSFEGKKLLAARLIALQGSGWEVFGITQAVRDWMEEDSSNHGLLVTIHGLRGAPVDPSMVQFASGRDHHESKKPMLVLFTDDGRRGAALPVNSLPDLSSQTLEVPAEPLAPEVTGVRNARSLDRFLPCQRQLLSVDFEEIGWSGWIISPRSYNAYHCKGSCPFPLGENMRPTNHATVQSIINALKLSQGVGSPCCVPDKLFSINLLYFDDDENVVLKQYDDMVAGSCGCH
ncbi:uncharacterized protein LOC102453510 isoform X4 [Pelodiscus sinensis]|uniref:uncharacterized protein LOC102453510 isoform X4 n=1 Tax=Pelodiscus sinensis TaxID=13735 RepID=UPI003F6BADB0